MRLLLPIVALPALALVAGCNSHKNGENAVLTNSGDVVLNDSMDNAAFKNDDEQPGNQADNMGAPVDNGASANDTGAANGR